jgi:glycine/D-amino acid oxidase-like deaminating enzyme/nitrite reductase/ring-hydroxylating ferredoxin subunit
MRPRFPARPPLKADQKADVCVIGAGIAGMTAAYLLAREGMFVVVVDDGPIGAGQTQRSSAHLSNAIDDRYREIERLHGEHGARLAAESHSAAIDRIEEIATRERADCEFERVDGYLFGPGDDSDLLRAELEAAHRAGLSDVAWVDRAPLEPFDTGPCLRFPRQAQFHPLRYLAGIACALNRDGGRVYAAHAVEIDGGHPARVCTTRGPVIVARAVVVATNSPVNDLVAIHTKQAAYLTYVMYDPSRKTLGAVGRFAREAGNMAWQYTDWLTPGDVSTPAAIGLGSGAVVRRGLKKLALYRDDEGGLHELSAVCPHLGGIVSWNAHENTWDCPCHGSRFDRHGHVLLGPANRDLEQP